MTSKFIWQIGEDWSITKVSKGNNKLFADAKATPVYAVLGNSQMLETDTVEMTCTINGQSYHKVLLHYAKTSNRIIVDDEAVAGWEVVSNGEELQTETSNFDVMTISFDVKRFSSVDGTTLFKNQPTGQTTENVYASNSYTPMVESSDAERIEHLIDELNAVKQDKYDLGLETEAKYVTNAINEVNAIKQNKYDDLLETTNKTVVGAINELNDEIEGASGDVDAKIEEHNTSETAHQDIRNDISQVQSDIAELPNIYVPQTYAFEDDNSTVTHTVENNNSHVLLRASRVYHTQPETRNLTDISVQDSRITSRVISAGGSNSYNRHTSSQFAIGFQNQDTLLVSRNNLTFKGNEVETQNNKTTILDSSSTNTQYPSTKSVYDFVNSSINNVAAFYITADAQGHAFETYAQLSNAIVFYSGGEVRVPTRNDYCIVRVDEEHENATTRYTYQNNQWEYQYTVNETPLTVAQLAAINSGITSAKVQQIDTNASNITNLQTQINGKQDTLTFDTTPTANSTNPVTSGGIKIYVDNAIQTSIVDVLNTPV